MEQEKDLFIRILPLLKVETVLEFRTLYLQDLKNGFTMHPKDFGNHLSPEARFDLQKAYSTIMNLN